MSFSRFKEYWWIAPVLAMLLTEFFYPLGYDNITYQSMGWQLAEYGRLPYIDTWDQNFPLIVYVHALSVWIFGNSTIGFRMQDVLLQLGSIVLLYQFTKLHFGVRPAALAALLFAGMYVFYGEGTFGQRDAYAAPFMLGALWSASRRRSSSPLLAGAFLAVAILFRPTNAVLMLPLLYLTWQTSRSTGRGPLTPIIACAIGLALVLLLGLSPYLTAERFEQFWLATFRYNVDVYGTSAYRFISFERLIAPIESLLTPLVAAALTFAWRRKPEPRRLLIGLGVAVLLVKLMIYYMGKFYMYQYAPVYYLSLPVLAYAAIELADRYRVRTWLRIGAMTCLLLVFTFRRSPAAVLLEGWQGMEATIEKINTRYKTSKWSSFSEMSVLVDRIRNNTCESDLIETCSWDNQIVWRTGRLQSSRFTLIHPVGMESRTGYMPYQHEWRQELALSIAERKPKYVVLATKPREFIATVIGRPRDLLLEIPGFAEALAKGYNHDTTIACYELYRRKD